LDSVRSSIRKELTPEDQDVEDDSMEIKPADLDWFEQESEAPMRGGQITPGSLHRH